MKLFGIFKVLGFRPYNTVLWSSQRDKALSCLKFPEGYIKRKLKFPGFFSKKVFSQHPSVWNYKRKSCKFSPLDKRALGGLFILDTFIFCGMYAYPNSNPFPPPSQECTFKWNMLFRGLFSLNWPKI